MGTVLYLDCSSGASGDMLLGALIDLGLPVSDLRAALGALLPEGTDLRAEKVMRSGISATGFTVVEPSAGSETDVAPHGPRPHAHGHGHAHGHADDASSDRVHAQADQHGPAHAGAGHHHRPLRDIYDLIEQSALAPGAKQRARALYERLGRVEADIHQTPVEQVHLHEVGALDSVVDIVGVVWAIDALGIDRVVASPMNVGGGRVRTAHGLLPVPAPATLRLLGQAPVFSDGTPFELLTPTGALLVTGHASSWGVMPAMIVDRVGYGAGARDLPSHPNVLRAVLGHETGEGHGDRVVVIDTNIDDMNPQIFGAVIEQLYERGALEVFYTPVLMKKSRPGTLVTVIAPPSRRDALMDVLFRETTTIGIRFRESARECLARETIVVTTAYGDVRIKVARRDNRPLKGTPEFDDCARLGREQGVAVRDVLSAAQRAYESTVPGGPIPGFATDKEVDRE